jgi:ribosome-binding factor A
MASEERQKRLADNVAHLVAEILNTELKEPLPAVTTITGAELSKDLANARVYYTVLGEAAAQSATARRLARVASFIQRELGKRLRLRVTPAVRFVYDEQAKEGDRVLKLLSDLKRDEQP